MTEQFALNLALGAGFAPIFFGFFISLTPDIREKMIENRTFSTIAAAACILVFTVSVWTVYNSLLDVLLVTAISAGLCLLWAQRLGYWRKKLLGAYKMAAPEKVSIFDYLFGASRNARVYWWAGFIVLGIPLMAATNIPAWITATSPVWFFTLSWALEDLKFINGN